MKKYNNRNQNTRENNSSIIERNRNFHNKFKNNFNETNKNTKNPYNNTINNYINKEPKAASQLNINDKEVTQKLKFLLYDLESEEAAKDFLLPIKETTDKDTYEDYIKVVKRPIDFYTIKKRFSNHYYQNLKDLYDDIILIFDNCLYYNSESSSLYRNATALKTIFKSKFNIHFPNNDLTEVKHIDLSKESNKLKNKSDSNNLLNKKRKNLSGEQDVVNTESNNNKDNNLNFLDKAKSLFKKKKPIILFGLIRNLKIFIKN